MDINEAYSILGAARNDDENTIKKKYKRLLFLHHPDSKRHRGENPDDTMAMRIIEAYKVIRQSSDSEYDQIKDDWDFEAAVNEKAFSNRNVYVQYRIYDDDALYYVVLPLLEEPNVEVSAQMKRLIKTGRNKNSIMIIISLNIPKELKDVPVAYTEQIQKALWGRGYRSKK